MLGDRGNAETSAFSLAARDNVQPCQTRCYQFRFRDPDGFGPGAECNLSAGLQVDW